MILFRDSPPSRDELLADLSRFDVIGSSEAAMALNASPYGDAFLLYARKAGYMPYEFEEPEDGPLYWGKLLEPIIAAEYAKRTCRNLFYPRTVFSEEHPFVMAHIDRYAFDMGADENAEPRIAEMKNYRSAAGWGIPGSDDIPPEVIIQLQHQMIASGLRVADVAVLIGGQEFRTYTVHYSEHLAEEIVKREAELMQRVVNRDPPEPDLMQEWTVKTLKLINKPTRERVELSADVERNLRRYKRVKGLMKRLESSARAEQGLILQAMADAQRGTTPNGWRITRAKNTDALSITEPKELP